MKELQDLMNDISEWSDATFGYGQRNPAIAYHLKKEVHELIIVLEEMKVNWKLSTPEGMRARDNVSIELADCLMLLLDSAKHAGFTAEQLVTATRYKLEINKRRKWGKPDANGVVEHIKPPQGGGTE